MGLGHLAKCKQESIVRDKCICPRFFTKEPIVHSHVEDLLPEKHPLAFEHVSCDACKEVLLHAANNECMQTWIETEYGNYCTKCFKFSDVLETLEECLGIK